MRLQDYKYEIISNYYDGQSMTSLAKEYGVYPNTIQRLLLAENVKLRHDSRKKGQLVVDKGEQLLEWAKAQHRLVTKSELAKIAGTKRLSPSYFIKYPELGLYVVDNAQSALKKYYDRLYIWLGDNNISYKPGDRTKLNVKVDVLLLEEYENIILQIAIQPKGVSKRRFNETLDTKLHRAKDANMPMILVTEKDFDHLDHLLTRIKDAKSFM